MSAATQRLLYAHPLCCFCGGEEKAVNLDHQPARIMFPDGHRPKGVEFPACAARNQQTRQDEALVAFLARVTGKHRYPRDRFEKGLSKAIIAVSRAFPLVLAQIVRPLWVRGEGSADQAPQRQRKETRCSGSKKRNVSEPRERVLRDPEVGALWQALDAAPLKFGSCCAAQSVAHADYVCRDNR